MNISIDWEAEWFAYVAKQCEPAWRESLPRYSPKELFDVYKPQEVIREKIAEWKADLAQTETSVRRSLRKLKDKDEKMQIFWKEWLALTDGERMLEAKRQIRRLYFLLKSDRAGPGPPGGITRDDIERARKADIERLCRDLGIELRPSGLTRRGLCPFHHERTSSFHVWPGEGRFHCFGCGKHGDSIDLVMKLKRLSFKQTIYYLQTYG